MAYWPEEHRLMFLSGKGNYYAEFDTSSKKWVTCEAKISDPIDVFGARTDWDDRRQRWLFRLGAEVAYWDPIGRAWKKLPRLPQELDEIPHGGKKWHKYKGIAWISKHDVYIANGRTGADTYILKPGESSWKRIDGGDLELPNGYLEYDEVTDQTILVWHRKIYTFRYDPN